MRFILIALATLSAAPLAQARDFFDASGTMTVTYSAVDGLHFTAVADAPVRVRMSNDGSYCQVESATGMGYPCFAYSRGHRSPAALRLRRSVLIALVVDALNSDSSIPRSGHRTTRLLDLIDRVFDSSDEVFFTTNRTQLHDGPESIHVTFRMSAWSEMPMSPDEEL